MAHRKTKRRKPLPCSVTAATTLFTAAALALLARVVLSEKPFVLSSQNQNWFPDHDCRNSEKWNHWREQIRDQPTWLRPENTKVQAGIVDFYLKQNPSGQDQAYHYNDPADPSALLPHEEKMYEDCYLGALYSGLIVMLTCWLRQDSCYFENEQKLQRMFPPLRVLIGTEWPILETLAETDWSASPSAKDLQVTCDFPTEKKPLVDWTRFKEVFTTSPNSWFDYAVKIAYGRELEQNTQVAIAECPLGFLTANIVKALLCANTESVCFPAHAGANYRE
ncbi:unnamed protein product [Amoebophrya sp. A120]|nr:unnamed protein product [Amoebophrya sp. A120]|eukprot:GSA120T00022538001.1